MHDAIYCTNMCREQFYSVHRHYMMDDLYIPSYYPNINSSDYVYVDCHVSSTPVLMDIDGDGGSEIIFAVSYYFDRKDYSGLCYWFSIFSE